jgi:hypothetical protein
VASAFLEAEGGPPALNFRLKPEATQAIDLQALPLLPFTPFLPFLPFLPI